MTNETKVDWKLAPFYFPYFPPTAQPEHTPVVIRPSNVEAPLPHTAPVSAFLAQHRQQVHTPDTAVASADREASPEPPASTNQSTMSARNVPPTVTPTTLPPTVSGHRPVTSGQGPSAASLAAMRGGVVDPHTYADLETADAQASAAAPPLVCRGVRQKLNGTMSTCWFSIRSSMLCAWRLQMHWMTLRQLFTKTCSPRISSSYGNLKFSG